MALTRKFLAALGIEESKIESIIDAHTETVDGLKKERDDYKAEADKLPKVQDELKKAQAAAKNSDEYDKLKKEYDDYKAEVADKETLANKKAAFQKVAKDAGLTEAGIAKAARYQDYSKIELDEKGEIKDAKALMKTIKEEWPEHIAKTKTTGADTPDPPGGGGDDKNQYADIRAMTAKWHAAKYGEAPKAAGSDTGAQN